MAAAAGYHCHSVAASRLFWEIVGLARPRLPEVEVRIALDRVQSNRGSHLLKLIGPKRRF